MRFPFRSEPPEQRIAALIEKHRTSQRAFFLMRYPEGEEPRWPPRQVTGRTISGWVDALRIAAVNDAWLATYAFPAGRSPIGWTLDHLTGSRTASIRVLVEFYSIGGYSTAELMRPRMDGHIMKLRGEYQILHHRRRLLGHFGLESDLTTELVRPPDGTLS